MWCREGIETYAIVFCFFLFLYLHEDEKDESRSYETRIVFFLHAVFLHSCRKQFFFFSVVGCAYKLFIGLWEYCFGTYDICNSILAIHNFILRKIVLVFCDVRDRNVKKGRGSVEGKN